MIISRTPFRVSLFGGGSDYPKWYCQHGGAVLGFAIDKYCYISTSLSGRCLSFSNTVTELFIQRSNVSTISPISSTLPSGPCSRTKRSIPG